MGIFKLKPKPGHVSDSAQSKGKFKFNTLLNWHFPPHPSYPYMNMHIWKYCVYPMYNSIQTAVYVPTSMYTYEYTHVLLTYFHQKPFRCRQGWWQAQRFRRVQLTTTGCLEQMLKCGPLEREFSPSLLDVWKALKSNLFNLGLESRGLFCFLKIWSWIRGRDGKIMWALSIARPSTFMWYQGTVHQIQPAVRRFQQPSERSRSPTRHGGFGRRCGGWTPRPWPRRSCATLGGGGVFPGFSGEFSWGSFRGNFPHSEAQKCAKDSHFVWVNLKLEVYIYLYHPGKRYTLQFSIWDYTRIYIYKERNPRPNTPDHYLLGYRCQSNTIRSFCSGCLLYTSSPTLDFNRKLQDDFVSPRNLQVFQIFLGVLIHI